MQRVHTHNRIPVQASIERCFELASEVERWPDILAHYREVRYERKDGPGAGRVYMSAYRHFGLLPYPVWWVSEMTSDASSSVRYRHVAGITTGMDVEWMLQPTEEGTEIVIIHDWEGPSWPVIGRAAARAVIGPQFIHVVAQRTLRGIKAAAEAK